MACAQCGQPNAPNAAACAQCGAQLGAPTWAPPGYSAPQAKKGWSTGALVAIVVAVVLVVGVGVVGIVAAIAIPSLIRARSAANESSALGAMRTIGIAEAAYYSTHATYGDLDDLQNEDLLDEVWRKRHERNSYRFTCVRADENGFEVHAEPLPDTATAGERSFTITEDYVVRYAKGPKAPPGTTGRVLDDD